MQNPIKAIVEWNKKAGLLDMPHIATKEDAYIIEEALEDHSGLTMLADQLNMKEPENADAKGISRTIMAFASYEDNELTDLARLDKACDKVVFAIGDMAKLGLSAQEITNALNIVMTANNQKLSAGRDAEGKQMKPEGFIPPEGELQKLLDKRGQ